MQNDIDWFWKIAADTYNDNREKGQVYKNMFANDESYMEEICPLDPFSALD